MLVCSTRRCTLQKTLYGRGAQSFHSTGQISLTLDLDRPHKGYYFGNSTGRSQYLLTVAKVNAIGFGIYFLQLHNKKIFFRDQVLQKRGPRFGRPCFTAASMRNRSTCAAPVVVRAPKQTCTLTSDNCQRGALAARRISKLK